MKGYDFLNKKNFSATLSLVLVRIVFVIIIACCIFAPLIVRVYDNGIIALTGSSVYLPMIITLYLAAAVALVIVTALDRQGVHTRQRENITAYIVLLFCRKRYLYLFQLYKTVCVACGYSGGIFRTDTACYKERL